MRIAVGIAGAFILLAGVASASAQSLPGNYQVEGKNLDGSAYSGTAEIVATSETTCRIVWKTGGTTANGICMRNGDSFAAGYVLGESVGLVVYKMNADGTLEGVWTIADQEGVGEETLTRSSDDPRVIHLTPRAPKQWWARFALPTIRRAARALTLLAMHPSISRIILI